MARPHPALLELAAGRPMPAVPPSDVEAVVASAFEHRVAGLLYSASQRGEVELPAHLVRLLAQHDLRAQAHQRRLLAGLGHVLDVAERHGVELAMAKGLAAQARWFDRAGERPSKDLDLVVVRGEPQQVAQVVHTLEPGHLFGELLERIMTSKAVQSVDVVLPGSGIELDLHLDLFKLEVPMRHVAALGEHLDEVVLADGTRVQTLDAELSLVHFLLHLNKDRFARLLGFVDVARILQRADLDWDAVEDLAGREGLSMPVQRSLRVVTEVLGIERVQLDAGTGWRGRVWDRLWPVDQHLLGDEGIEQRERRQYWLPWLAEGRAVAAGWWFVRRRALPPEVYVRYYYGDLPGPYLLRLVRGRLGKLRRRRTRRWEHRDDGQRPGERRSS